MSFTKRDRPTTHQKHDRPTTHQKRDRPIPIPKMRSLNKLNNSYCYLLLLQREY
ncbi:hypothetical protein H6F44_22555 [Pseudanabaena sp. FACHB-1277]|uniref:Uncharacterized protein n=1 Tax=Pseudanabaena cinerea FACHB-1277 TaxID=2949581 RepID=A0A926ZAF0_9CYAN|nr:hypothetical protein [Pseudanabaena cinerea]MBD2152869.1 hypothetical protein [Pseudanabaena cinerea FACHB-1277]